MTQIRLLIIILIFACDAVAEIETDRLKKAYYFVYSTCANCCQSGKGLHAYISRVIYTTGYDYDNSQGAFFDQVKIDYPNGEPIGTISNGFTSESAAKSKRRSMISHYSGEDYKIHEIKW